MQHRLLVSSAAFAALLAGCSALVHPDLGRLGDGGPGAGDAGARADAGRCAGTQVACGGLCVDPSADALHCGGCDRACAPGAVCVSGTCACAPADPGCVPGPPPLGDPDRCGIARCRDDQVCASGRCACRPGLTPAGDRCVDLGSDPEHCGALGHACPAVCALGRCLDRCDGSLVDCDGSCVDPSANVLHCGECGRGCERDQVCIAGDCRDYAATPSCDACGGDTPRCCSYAAGAICVDASGCPS